MGGTVLLECCWLTAVVCSFKMFSHTLSYWILVEAVYMELIIDPFGEVETETLKS